MPHEPDLRQPLKHSFGCKMIAITITTATKKIQNKFEDKNYRQIEHIVDFKWIRNIIIIVTKNEKIE